MSRAPFPLDQPGEDSLDLPEALGRLVALCTWVRGIALGLGEVPGRLRAQLRGSAPVTTR